MGLGNQAVSRLSQTWERLPSKLRRTFEDLENLIDPSRNHKRYRSAVAKLQPPLVSHFLIDLSFVKFSDASHFQNIKEVVKLFELISFRHVAKYRS